MSKAETGSINFKPILYHSIFEIPIFCNVVLIQSMCQPWSNHGHGIVSCFKSMKRC